MIIIKDPLLFEGDLGEASLYALFDSGATYSYINPDLLEGLASPINFKNPMLFGTASAETFIKVNTACRLDFYMDDIRLTDEFYVVLGLSEEIIIGATTMQKWRIKLDFEQDKAIVDPKVAKLILVNLTKD